MSEFRASILATGRRHCIFALAFAFGMLVLWGCSGHPQPGGPGESGPGPNEIWLQSHAFVPASITVPVGTTMTWVNKDWAVHNVTSGIRWKPDGIFASGSLWHNTKFRYTFKQPGTFPYYCSIHSHMEGEIVVK